MSGVRGWFERYLAAFNARDYDGFGAYYAEDVAFFGQAAQLVGRDAVVRFYREVHGYLDERIELLDFVAAPAGDRLLAEIRTTLVAHRDWPEMPTGSMAAGERRESVNFAFYEVADGRFTRIRSARFAPARPA